MFGEKIFQNERKTFTKKRQIEGNCPKFSSKTVK